MALRVTLVCTNWQFEIPANPYPMYPHAEQLNHVSLDAANGRRYVFNNGPTRINASIVWKCVDYETVQNYENFLLNYAKLGLNPFMIACPDYIDFGKGKGKNIGVIKYSESGPYIFGGAYYAGSPKLKDVISPRGGDGMYYDIELPYMFVRDD